MRTEKHPETEQQPGGEIPRRVEAADFEVEVEPLGRRPELGPAIGGEARGLAGQGLAEHEFGSDVAALTERARQRDADFRDLH